MSDGKPMPWYVVAIESLLLVWTAIMSAFVIMCQSPTIGLGCRTFVYLAFGSFSSVPWFIQFSKKPGRFLRLTSLATSASAVTALVTAILFQVSCAPQSLISSVCLQSRSFVWNQVHTADVIQVTGLSSNCFCKSSVMGLEWGKAYMDLEDYGFYRKNFEFEGYWIGAAVVGGLSPTTAFVVALF